MKKLLAVVVLGLIWLAGCGSYDEDYEEYEKYDEQFSKWLYDIDYLMYVLENNFVMFDAVYRIRGYDINAMADRARALTLRQQGMTQARFQNILDRSFRMSVAHFEFQLPLPEFLMQPPPAVHGIHTILPYYEVLSLRVLEEGRIAYIGMRTFMMDQVPFGPIFDFYHEIQGFEHLIVDIRGAGGWVDRFFQTIVYPNITEPITARGYGFVQTGPYVVGTRHIPINSPRYMMLRGTGFTTDRRFTPIHEFLEEINLPMLYISDTYRADYGFRVERAARPRLHEEFGGQVAFDGRIWVLICGGSMSGGQIVSWFIDETGFATLVGETSGGYFGGYRANIHLPNSGVVLTFDVVYLTDSRGQAFEEGTRPHYFNLEGMDALETVLALIQTQ